MKNQIQQAVSAMVQTTLDHVVRDLSVPFRYRVGTIRSEDGYFKVIVLATTPKTSIEASRIIFSITEQRIEEELQGLRLMILPGKPRTSSARKRKAA